MAGPQQKDEAATARLLLLLLALAWGLSWPFMKIALDEMGVFTFRALGYSLGALSLFAVIRAQGRKLAPPSGRACLHVGVAGLIIVVGFGLFSSLAQLNATTSRVVIINYSMPVWSSLLAWLVLGERLHTRTAIGLVLCVAGLATLLYPVVGTHSMLGLLFALCCALCWGGGTVYMKWARIPGDLLTNTAWQILLGAIFFGAGVLLFPHATPVWPHATPVWTVSTPGVLALLYNGLIGTSVAYLLWFAIIERLPTAVASLGSLSTPVVGVLGSVVILGERPSMTDAVGFALIFAAATCVLLQPSAQMSREAP